MQTIGNALKSEIENYAQSLAQSSELIRAAEKGLLTSRHISAYVSGLLFLIRGALRVLDRAERRARAKGDLSLADYYHQKLSEEEGHDRWAQGDLAKLPPAEEYGRNLSTAALGRLLTYLDRVVAQDPCLFLPYMLLAEYLTVLVGPGWLRTLETRCGIPQSSVTVVANHVELDKEHVMEGIQAIDFLANSADNIQPMLTVLRRSFSYLEEFLDEILSTVSHAA